ncbi:MAG: hypothetical protein COA79_05205 [Planctomycetota bacterium]|nr:MAG: hypothetical protein COA79_05205 [Planctomycetota bacterium]
MFQQLNTKLTVHSLSQLLIKAVFLFLIVSCGKNISVQESNKIFLNNKPGDKNFEKILKSLAEELYRNKWGVDIHLIKPKFRNEKMQVEWENKNTKKMKRKFSSLRCQSIVDRLALSYICSLTGPVNIKKLMSSVYFKSFRENLNQLLTQEKNEIDLQARLLENRNEVLVLFDISLQQAEQNEKKYRVGILITAGFYLGLPIYKRITLDININTRREILRIYLHECGHQLFHKSRRFSKSLKLGLSWIGWRKTASSWWMVEEKSCNLFAEMILKDWEKELKKQSLYSTYIKLIGPPRWKRTKFVKKFKERYASLFFDKTFAMRRLYNKRIQSRYSTKDKIAGELRTYLKKHGIQKYLRDVNSCNDLKGVLLKIKREPKGK